MSDVLGAEYRDFHQQLVIELQAKIKTLPPFNSTETGIIDPDNALFVTRLNALASDLNAQEDGVPLGQWLVSNVIMRYPHITPEIPRDLFWFFGGDCMHFLGEEEIEKFQQLEEAFHDNTATSDNPHTYASLRTALFGVRKLFKAP
ncbi:PA2817 family protein [Teredinibacter purpureus]|uniref:PA2817 family protein n=1 Tax=Teredinibacter purpureus TaxID=2731756 RepID=UPI000697C6B1|nr:PA2817 family protein [Teredinibacter purpureus]